MLIQLALNTHQADDLGRPAVARFDPVPLSGIDGGRQQAMPLLCSHVSYDSRRTAVLPVKTCWERCQLARGRRRRNHVAHTSLHQQIDA